MKKRGIVSEALPWLLIGIVILAISFVIIFMLKDKGVSMIDSIKNLFKGRG
jgi:Na+/melibiose symporter-like transporter